MSPAGFEATAAYRAFNPRALPRPGRAPRQLGHDHPYLQYPLSPRQFIQVSWWAPLWEQWYATQGASGEEPPPEFKEYLDLAIGWAAETDEDKAQQMARDANIMAYEKALWLGVGAGAQQFTFVRDTLVNMPLGHFQPDSWVAWKYFPEGWWLE